MHYFGFGSKVTIRNSYINRNVKMHRSIKRNKSDKSRRAVILVLEQASSSYHFMQFA